MESEGFVFIPPHKPSSHILFRSEICHITEAEDTLKAALVCL